MSEQEQDFNSFQEHLERIFKDLDDGVFITQAEIADLRYACGLQAKPTQQPIIKSLFEEFGTIFGASK